MSSSCQCLRIKEGHNEKKGNECFNSLGRPKVKKVILLVNKALIKTKF